MIKIGLTGGIGCGKSYVAELLRKRGIPVYDSDTESKRLLQSDIRVLSSIEQVTGVDLLKNGVLDKEALTAFVFASPINAEAVNAIVHPAVKLDFIQWANRQKADFCVIESALMYESGFDDSVDFMVAVDAPESVRIDRCLRRDGTDVRKVRKRMALQIDQAEKCRRADFVINNDGSTALEPQIDMMFQVIGNK